MKKGDIVTGTIEYVNFPNKGVLHVEDVPVTVKDSVVAGETVSVRLTKKRGNGYEARLVEVVQKAPIEVAAPCPNFGICGGCTWMQLPAEEEEKLKGEQVLRLLDRALTEDGSEELGDRFEGVLPSPVVYGYRNKMELSFGDSEKGGPLKLGLHKKGSFYDIVSVGECLLMDADGRKIARATEEYFAALREEGKVDFYHKMQRTGFLRHLLLRKAYHTGEILVDLVTTPPDGAAAGVVATAQQAAGDSADTAMPKAVVATGSAGHGADDAALREEELTNIVDGWKDMLLSLPLEGHFAGILHTVNGAISDAVIDEGTTVLYGKDSFEEELLGLSFHVTPFSFFQTNSYGAEVLYRTAREYLAGTALAPTAGYTQDKPDTVDGECCEEPRSDADISYAGTIDHENVRKPVVFDLYTGTGTIAQLIAPAASKVIGVEIVPEAVEAAKENAARNGLTNGTFIAGDVLKVLDTIDEKPDVIILDPPRDGVHPKALQKILDYGVQYILYISCKPTSLARDLGAFLASGYRPVRACCVDQFCWTANVETISLMQRA